jgi:hypothetical protein
MGTLYAAILQPCFSPYIDVNSEEIRARLSRGLAMIEKVADLNEITQQCKEYFTSLQQAINQSAKKTDAPIMQHADIFQPLLANMEATIIPEPSFEAQLFDTHQQINHIGAEVFSGDWNAIYGAADIFKDPLLPEFGLNWLDS